MWPESFIAKAKDCTESVQVYEPHRPPKLLRINVSFRNSASKILFRTYFSRNFFFVPHSSHIVYIWSTKCTRYGLNAGREFHFNRTITGNVAAQVLEAGGIS